jgi:tetratricopeptide (TPR) repeat protein
VGQFTRIGDFLFGEGFLPKAAALYKKALKAKGDHEHTLSQLGEIAIRQGLIADAKMYFRQLAQQRRARGDERGAAETLVRLGSADQTDVDSKIAGARAALEVGNPAGAAALMKAAGEALEKQGRKAEALDVFVEAAQLDPGDSALRAKLAHVARILPAEAGSHIEDEELDLSTLGTSEAPLAAGASDVASGFSRKDVSDGTPAVFEIDLSEALSGIEPAAPVLPTDRRPPDLESVFEQMRTRSTQQQQLATAAAQLGRLLVEQGDLKGGVDWLERAAEAPPPTPEEGFALLYDLADALDRLGESARALAVMLELDADAAGYRDVRERVARLSRAQAGSRGA